MKATLLLMLACSSGFAQTQTTLPRAEQARAEFQFAELEEIAMCHHAIKAAKHDGLALGQNPYYRYILYSPQKGHGSNVYPIPERCKSVEVRWVLSHSQLDAEFRALQDETIKGQIQMTIPEISADAQFLTVVISKIELEGKDAFFWENRDKDIPQ